MWHARDSKKKVTITWFYKKLCYYCSVRIIFACTVNRSSLHTWYCLHKFQKSATLSNVKLLFYKEVYDWLRKEVDTQDELKKSSRLEQKWEWKWRCSTSPTTSANTPLISVTTTSAKVISVKDFRKELNICDAINYFVSVWTWITAAKVNHVWAPLLPQLIKTQDKRQCHGDLLQEAVESFRSVWVLGFCDVDVE